MIEVLKISQGFQKLVAEWNDLQNREGLSVHELGQDQKYFVNPLTTRLYPDRSNQIKKEILQKYQSSLKPSQRKAMEDSCPISI